MNYSPAKQLNLEQATLLVVEDQDDIWTLLRFALKKVFPDILIYRTRSHKDTIAYINDGLANRVALPKLILQDLYIPSKDDGFRLLNDIVLSQQQQIPVLVISSSTDTADVQQAYQCHASYYIVKPISIDHWLTLCQSLRHFWWDQGILPIRSAPTAG